jgi:hypothetical protein
MAVRDLFGRHRWPQKLDKDIMNLLLSNLCRIGNGRRDVQRWRMAEVDEVSEFMREERKQKDVVRIQPSKGQNRYVFGKF